MNLDSEKYRNSKNCPKFSGDASAFPTRSLIVLPTQDCIEIAANMTSLCHPLRLKITSRRGE